MENKIIFISWTNFSRHSDLLAKAFGAKIYYINDFIYSRGIIWKLFFWLDYSIKSIRTLNIIWKSNPKFVFVQNPPSIAPIIIILFRKFGSYKVLIDSHNGAFEGMWKNFILHKWALRNADIVSVHNKQLIERLLNDYSYKNINFKILGSKFSDFSRTGKEPQKQAYILAVITFAIDEPVEILLEGLSEFNKSYKYDLKFKLTGDYKKNYSLFEKYSKSENIEFLGYVDEEKYNYYLVNSIGIIALSTRDDVQQFAISEAISAEIPFISNNNSTNIDLFDDKMVLSELSPLAISHSVDAFIKNREQLKINIIEIKKNIVDKWTWDFSQIKEDLGI
jgi:glycosyltransferase involved in cell wall biosynthesis